MCHRHECGTGRCSEPVLARSPGVPQLRPVLTFVKVVLRLVPSVFQIVMHTTEMRQAINPYSMAVAPVSSLAKSAMVLFMRRVFLF
jgi:hypothetical protein